VTEDLDQASADALRLVRELTRTAGHEIRNALNGVAVNVEVVRSRIARDPDKKELLAFAERAVAQVGVANTLTDSLSAFVGCVLAAQAHGTLRAVDGGGAGTRLELMIYGERAESLVSAIKRFGELTGVAVEQHNGRVILSLSSEGRSHSKE
jgi:signal transduction histidine kinase